MLNHQIAVALTPVKVGMAAGGALHLHRFAVAIRLGLAHFWSKNIPRVTGIVQNQAVALARRQTQPLPTIC
ncbi:hypothetical protein HORIV_55310 [Vreelandella olivaria]|uniref:Uncharacterized protein n=1 Tax=Vreelandella olivaria TaxID=390919 RepID=A0ABN5X1X2_9GAMM|nr:hypothetical protein HORIV_55310 [Halomonas olivaria]